MKNNERQFIILVLITLVIVLSFIFNFIPGKEIAGNLLVFSGSMFAILPVAFILIGLFEVWVSKETIEAQMGKNSGIKGYLWAIVLAGPTAGGMYVSFPVAYALFKKGANLKVIFFYVGCVALCRIPMTLIEASFLGIKFTFLRLAFALPLVLISSMLLGSYLQKQKYKITIKNI